MAEDAKRAARDNRISVDLKDAKEPWATWCARRGLTPSEGVRRVLRHLMATDAGEDLGLSHTAAGTDDGRRRVEVRFSAQEYLAMVAAADREGMTLARWINALVSVHLTEEIPIGRDEIEVLARSNQLLLALDRSVNKIAYNISERSESDALTLGQIEFVASFLKEHTQATSALIHANTKRWRR